MSAAPAVRKAEVSKQKVWALQRGNSQGAPTAWGDQSPLVPGERGVEQEVTADRGMEVPISPLTAEGALGDCSPGVEMSF